MLKNDIGANAGVIWHLLLDNGALSVRQIGEHTGYREKIILLSLGWLAREDKINFFEKNKVVYVELKSSYSERYY